MRSTAALLASLVLLAIPASAQAAVTIGGTENPGSATACGSAEGCFLVQVANPGVATAAPFDGVITRWRARASGPVALAVARYTAEHTAMRPTTGPVENAPSADVVSSYATRLPIRAGDRVGIVLTTASAALAQTFVPDSNWEHWSPPPPESMAAPAIAYNLPFVLAYSADIEPDADRDGFGDETQDGCPGNALRQDNCQAPAPDVTPPAFVGRPKASPGVLRRGGTRLEFSLSEAARVDVRVERRSRGRRVRGKCRKETRRNSRRPRCRRYTSAGSLQVSGVAGANSVAYKPRFRGRRLPAGRYRVTMQATDATGNSSAPVSFGLRLKPLPRRPRR